MTQAEQEARKQAFIGRVGNDLPRGWPNGADNGPHAKSLDRKGRICFEFFTYRRDCSAGLQFYSQIPYRPVQHPDRGRVVGPFLRSRIAPLMEQLGGRFILRGQKAIGNSEGLFLKLELRDRHEGSFSADDLDNLQMGFLALLPVWNAIRFPEDEAQDWNRTHQREVQAYLENRCSFPDLPR